jgi:hypothetical protein
MLTRRLARLEAKLPPPSPELELRLRQCDPIFERWDALGAAAWPLLGAEEQGRVNEALERLHDGLSGPYALWFNGLLLGWSRLPPLAPAVMKDLLLAWLQSAVATGFVCQGCGLAYPFRHWPQPAGTKSFQVWPQGQGPPPRVPEFFAACPHCGAPNTDIHLPDNVEQHDHPWNGDATGRLRRPRPEGRRTKEVRRYGCWRGFRGWSTKRPSTGAARPAARAAT